MKKLLLALIVVALPTVCRAGVRSRGPNPGVFVKTVASTSTADITYYWAMDSATSGQSPQKGSGTITIGASWVSTTAVVGTNALYNSNTGNSGGKITVSSTSWNFTAGRWGAYMILRESTGASSIGDPFWIQGDTGTVATSKFILTVDSIGEWLLNYSNANQLNLGTNLLTQNTTAFIEVAWDYTGATLGAPCKVFKDGILQGTCSGTPNAGAPAGGTVQLGGQNANATALVMDQFIYSTDPNRDLNALKNTTSF